MEPIGQTLPVPVSDTSQVALARRTARHQALRVGLPESRADEVEIVAVEMATNLVRHGGGGTLFINPFIPLRTLEIIAVDSGPGMADVVACSEDGFSSGTTPGLGLGSIQRLSDKSSVYSQPGKGSIISACFLADPTQIVTPGVLCTAMAGEEVSGDRWAMRRSGSDDLVLVVDGLGHGLQAAEAASMAVDIFMTASSTDPATLIQQMHGPMRSTRGAALSIALVDRQNALVRYCGVGNISANLQGAGRASHMISQNGTLGHQIRQVRSFDYPFAGHKLLILHSDGISTHWKLEQYPGLLQASPAAIASILHRDFNRGRDDATALVLAL